MQHQVQHHHPMQPATRARHYGRVLGSEAQAQQAGLLAKVKLFLAPEASQMSEEELLASLERIWLRLKTTVVRGGVAGLSIRGGLHLLSTLLWLLRTATSSKAKRKAAQRGLSNKDIVVDTFRYTLFLAALGGSFVAVDEGLALLLGKERTKAWRSMVAGAIAGHTVLLTGPGVRHHSLATYVLLRGLTLLVRCGNKAGSSSQPQQQLIHRLLGPTRWAHGDVLLMCLASSQIIYSYIMMPGTLPPSYTRFLAKQTAKEPFVWKAVREQALNNWQGLTPGRLKQLHGTPWQECAGPTPCEFWHPGHSCKTHAASIVPQSYLRALGVYIPVYLVPAVLVHRQKLLAQPKALLPKMLVGISRSALFLTSFIALAFAGACVGFNLTGTSTGPVIAASTAVGGLAILIEKKSRRMELALYCLSRALESFAMCLQAWGVVPDGVLPERTDVLLFSAGCAAIMHCYSDSQGEHRDVFRSKYLNVLDFVFGNTGVDEGAISHHPSNLDLLHTVTASFRSWSTGQLSAAGRSSSTPDLEHKDAGGSHSPATPRVWSSVQNFNTHHQHSLRAQLQNGSHQVHGNGRTALFTAPALPGGSRNVRLRDANGTLTLRGSHGHLGDYGSASALSPATASAPAFHSMRESLISQATASQQHLVSRSLGSSSTLSLLQSHDTTGSHSLSHYARHVPHENGRDAETSPHSSIGSSTSSSGASREAAETRHHGGIQQAGAVAAMSTDPLVRRVPSGHLSGRPQLATTSAPAGPATHHHAREPTVRRGATSSALSGWVSSGRLQHLSQRQAAAQHGQPLRRIATAPCIQSLVQLASLDSPGSEADGECRVHGGSDSQEHMVHNGQYYTHHDARMALLSSASEVAPSQPIAVPTGRARVVRHHSGGSQDGSGEQTAEIAVGAKGSGSPVHRPLARSLGRGNIDANGKQHGGSMMLTVGSLGHIPAINSVRLGSGSESGTAPRSTRSSSSSVQPVDPVEFTASRILTGRAVASSQGVLVAGAEAVNCSSAPACMLPLGSPFNGSPPDSPTHSRSGSHAHQHAGMGHHGSTASHVHQQGHHGSATSHTHQGHGSAASHVHNGHHGSAASHAHSGHHGSGEAPGAVASGLAGPAGAPAFTSFLGRSSGRLQYVPSSSDAAPLAVNVVHASGETTVIPPEQIIADAAQEISSASQATSVSMDSGPAAAGLRATSSYKRSQPVQLEGAAPAAFEWQQQPTASLNDVSFRSWSHYNDVLEAQQHAQQLPAIATTSLHRGLAAANGTVGTTQNVAEPAAPIFNGLLAELPTIAESSGVGGESDAASTDHEGGPGHSTSSRATSGSEPVPSDTNTSSGSNELSRLSRTVGIEDNARLEMSTNDSLSGSVSDTQAVLQLMTEGTPVSSATARQGDTDASAAHGVEAAAATGAAATAVGEVAAEPASGGSSPGSKTEAAGSSNGSRKGGKKKGKGKGRR